MALYGLTEAEMQTVNGGGFMNFGMNSGSDVHSHSTKAHYFFQGICEHYELNWREYGSKVPKDAKEWVKKNFPRLVGVDHSHSYGF